jgi:uncharacterized protein YjdB
MKRKVIIFAVVFSVFLFASCDDAASGTRSESPVPVAVTGVSLSPNSLYLAPGANGTLTVAVSPADATNKAVTWTSEMRRYPRWTRPEP